LRAIRIVSAGPLATIQDWGRYGFQDRGVPVSGAMDREALGIGNSLVGNAASEAAVEITLGGFSAEFLRSVLFAVTGADLSARLNGSPLSCWAPHPAHGGDVLTLDQRQSGCRAYLTVAGGIDVPVVMGSKSTYLLGGFGGFQGRRLQSGDVLKCGEPQGPTLSGWPADLIPCYRADPLLRVVPGPQGQAVTAQGWNRFLTGEYRLTERSDRMGCVLEGPVITHRHGADIISDGTAGGAVQVPGNGQPIVLLADRQTVGGYAKIATVVSCDLPLLAQLVPGDLVRFTTVDLWQAREIHLRRAYQLRQALHRLKARSPDDKPHS
jgi:biotin-dependent carboxylase-like uncharacterized protein